MWIFTSSGFVSAVAHRDKPDTIIVRARFKGDAAKFLGVEAKRELCTPDADYRFRVEATRDEFERATLEQAKSIDYPNFKNSIKDNRLHRIASSVWSVLYSAQVEAYRRMKPWKDKS